MLRLTNAIRVLLISIALPMVGCSTTDQSASTLNKAPFTVKQSLLLDEIPEIKNASKLRVSAISVTAPKAGDVVFTYDDLMPDFYISGARISGGAKRAEVIYRLEKDIEQLAAKALRNIFSVDSTSPYATISNIDFKFTEILKTGNRVGSQDVNVSVLLTLSIKINKGSENVIEKSFQAVLQDTNKPGLIQSTFPSNSFLNSLFRRALEDVLNTARSHRQLAKAFEQ